MTANQNGRYLKVNRFRKKKLFKFDRQGTMTVPQERTGPAFRSCSSSNLSVCIEMLRFCSSVDALCARTCSRNPVWASHAYLFTDGILNHWRSPSLTSTSDFRYFRHNGTIQVLKDGIYYVYSQVVDESVFGLKIAIFICKSLVSAISICASSVIWGAKSSEFKPVTVFCLGTVSQSTKWKYVLAICGERLPYYAAAPVFCATVLQRLRCSKALFTLYSQFSPQPYGKVMELQQRHPVDPISGSRARPKLQNMPCRRFCCCWLPWAVHLSSDRSIIICNSWLFVRNSANISTDAIS